MSRRGMLSGRSVVVTRPKAAARGLVARLEAHGARVLLLPTIRTTPAAAVGEIRRALRGPAPYDWLLFTSARAVGRLLRAAEGDPRALARLKKARIGAVGPATAGALRRRGFAVDVVPARHRASALAAEVRPSDGARILFPRSTRASRALPRILRGRGAEVVEVAAYATAYDVRPDPAFLRLIRRAPVDHLVFASPSAVAGFFHKVENEAAVSLLRVRVVAIGPATARAARRRGFTDVTVAEPHTEDGIVAAILRMNARPRI